METGKNTFPGEETMKQITTDILKNDCHTITNQAAQIIIQSVQEVTVCVIVPFLTITLSQNNLKEKLLYASYFQEYSFVSFLRPGSRHPSHPGLSIVYTRM